MLRDRSRSSGVFGGGPNGALGETRVILYYGYGFSFFSFLFFSYLAYFNCK